MLVIYGRGEDVRMPRRSRSIVMPQGRNLDREIMKQKIDILFTFYSLIFKEEHITLFLFYLRGNWDDNKFTLEEAIAAYPLGEFEWIFFEG